LTAGLRYSHIFLDAQIDDTTFFDFPFNQIDISTGAFNGSLGLIYSFGNNWQWNGLVSTGFRAPNLDDAGKVFDSEPGTVVVPNPDLNPEFSYNFETSLSKVISGQARLEGVVYYSLLRDAMVRRPFLFNGEDSLLYDGTLSRVEALVNTGEAYVFGWSLSFQTLFSTNWVMNGNLTYSEGRDNTDNIPLRHTTPVFGNFGLTWKKGKFRAQGLLRFNGQRRFSELPPSEQNKTHLYTEEGSLAWYTLNANFSYTPNNYLQITTSFENILDAHYRPYSSGISAPGFNWVLGVRGRF
jgi:hemoglobin/transferrin/lactoferrin receptor protein